MAAALALACGAGLGLPSARALEPVTIDLGVDMMERDHFALFQGKRVGLITNQTGVDSSGRTTREAFKAAPGVKLAKLFSPEHGIDGTVPAGQYVRSRKDRVTGLPVYSLYDATRKPSSSMLDGLDMLVFDMQDIGCRSYTYISTMVLCMEAAGDKGIPFVVLDRPNPLGGERVEGPMVEPRWVSFVSQVPVPYVHGLTVAELARMVNDLGWNKHKCRLIVVPMRGWERGMTWNDTGLRWVQTSPNIPYATSPAYYVVTGLAGSLSGLNIGIGTREPFQRFACAGVDGASMAARFRGLEIPGLVATPYADPLGSWEGVSLKIDPHARTNLCAMALYFLATGERRAHIFDRSTPSQLNLFYKIYGSATIRGKLANGASVGSIVNAWEPAVAAFREKRAPYLLY
ncbi:MAG: DUF1343 domain-containing protein [Verrucomicrobium sp.]|nr:DUF1343 domain-containing protein [Verrucomicrobium sp.]